MVMGMSFFVLCPFEQMGSHGPKNGMKLNKLLSIGGRLASSRFSGQMSMHNKGIAKKDISMSMHLARYTGPWQLAGIVFKNLASSYRISSL
jgi:hypothetical protein